MFPTSIKGFTTPLSLKGMFLSEANGGVWLELESILLKTFLLLFLPAESEPRRVPGPHSWQAHAASHPGSKPSVALEKAAEKHWDHVNTVWFGGASFLFGYDFGKQECQVLVPPRAQTCLPGQKEVPQKPCAKGHCAGLVAVSIFMRK